MTFERKLGHTKDGALVALESFLQQVQALPSADLIQIKIPMFLEGSMQNMEEVQASWIDGSASIPKLGFVGKVRPLHMLQAVKLGESGWPMRAFFQRLLDGPNRDLNYTVELLEVIKQFCIRGYQLHPGFIAVVSGRSGDHEHTPFFVKLEVQEATYVLSGRSPTSVPEEVSIRTGW